MFEGAVAGILNRLLGKYVQDLDTENLNVGIFSGNVNLTDLKLKPEALVSTLPPAYQAIMFEDIGNGSLAMTSRNYRDIRA